MIDEFQQPMSASEVSSPAKGAYKTKIDKTFIAQWMFACVIGYALGNSVAIMVAEKVGYSLWDTSVKALGLSQELGKYNYVFASALMGAIFGGIISFCQSVVLRRFIKNASRWILVGTVFTSVGITLDSIAYTVISSKVINL